MIADPGPNGYPEEIIESTEADIPEDADANANVGKADILKLISNALKIGTIDASQAKHMRQELGFSKSDFTKSSESSKIKKQKRKAQKQARAITRSNGFKGQKMTKGQASGRGR